MQMSVYIDFSDDGFTHSLFPTLQKELEGRIRFLEDDFKPHGHSSEEIRSWIRRVTSDYGLKPTQWARAADLSPSTINRFLLEDESPRNLGSSTIDRLLAVLRIMRTEGGLQKKGTSPGGYKPTAEWQSLVEVPIMGELNCACAMSLRDHEYFMIESLKLPIDDLWSSYPIAAFNLVDSDSEPVLEGHSTLLCVPFANLKRDPFEGERLVTFYIDDELDEMVRPALREFVRDPAGRKWLLPMGSSQAREPGTFFVDYTSTRPSSDGDCVISMLVIGSIRTFSTADPF